MSDSPADIPVLLLHGFLGCKDDWHEIAKQLQSGRRLAVFDLPGHGNAADAAEDRDCGMDSACHRVDAVLEALEAPCAHIVGYSLGARVALYYAITRPGCVASLVLESGSPGIEDEAERAARRQDDEQRAAVLARDGLEAFVKSWEEMPLFATQRRLDPKVLADQRARRLRGDAGALSRSLLHAGTGSQQWLSSHFHKIKAPVLLVAGELDEKYSKIAWQMQAALPNARCAIVEGAGHNVHLEKPEDFLDLVDAFLAAHAAAATRDSRLLQ